MLSYLLYTVFILSCVVLVVAVLLQPGKADAGALFTSSVSSTAFGPRGTQSVLARITIGAAVAFLMTALLLTMGVGSGERSVMEGATSSPAATPAPAAAASPQTDAPPAAAPQQGETAAPSPAAAGAAAPSPAASPQAEASPATK